MSNEDYIRRNESGDLSEYVDELEKKTGKSKQEITAIIEKTVPHLKYSSWANVFVEYYYNKNSIISIHYHLGLPYHRIDKYLDSAKKEIERVMICSTTK